MSKKRSAQYGVSREERAYTTWRVVITDTVGTWTRWKWFPWQREVEGFCSIDLGWSLRV